MRERKKKSYDKTVSQATLYNCIHMEIPIKEILPLSWEPP